MENNPRSTPNHNSNNNKRAPGPESVNWFREHALESHEIIVSLTSAERVRHGSTGAPAASDAAATASGKAGDDGDEETEEEEEDLTHQDDDINEMYTAFAEGHMVKGILCPSLTNSFHSASLERSYLTYSHRQRQKSLIIVNVVDMLVKIILAVVYVWRENPPRVSTTVILEWKPMVNTCVLFLAPLSDWTELDRLLYHSQHRYKFVGSVEVFCKQLSALGCRVYLDPFKHSKYILILVSDQTLIFFPSGFLAKSLGFAKTENLVWYVLFTIFAPYSMLPLPLKWCILGGSITAVGHLLYLMVKEFDHILANDQVSAI